MKRRAWRARQQQGTRLHRNLATTDRRRRGLFLDLDGTLADSISALRQAYYEFLGRFGIAGSDAEFAALNGPPLPRVVMALRQAHGLPDDAEELLSLYRGLAAAAQERALPATGASALLAEAQARGWRIAVVTSAARDATRAWLARAGLDGFVGTIVGGDEVSAGKPDPEPYRLALARSGCDAAASYAIEDSLQGATAATRAQLPTWMLGDPARHRAPDTPLFLGFLPRLQDLGDRL